MKDRAIQQQILQSEDSGRQGGQLGNPPQGEPQGRTHAGERQA